jgi:hypothetical protein
MLKVRAGLIILTVALLSLFASGWSRGEATSAGSRWEYRVIEFNGSSNEPAKDAEASLNQVGAEGWELVSTESSEVRPKITYLYLKRLR